MMEEYPDVALNGDGMISQERFDQGPQQSLVTPAEISVSGGHSTKEAELIPADFSALTLPQATQQSSETHRKIGEYDLGNGHDATPFDKLTDAIIDSFKQGDYIRGIANSAVAAGVVTSTIMCAGLECLGFSQGVSATSLISGLLYGGVGLALASGVTMAISYGVMRATHEYRRVTGQTSEAWGEAIPADSIHMDRMMPLPVWISGAKIILSSLTDYLGGDSKS